MTGQLRTLSLVALSTCVFGAAACDRSSPSEDRSRPLASDIADEGANDTRRPPASEPVVTEGVVSNPEVGEVPESWGEPHVLHLEPTGPNGELRPSGVPTSPQALLSPPDTGSGVPGLPEEPGDVMPQLQPPPSGAEQDLAFLEPPPDASGPPCPRSFDILRALARQANRAVPARAEYLQACEALPPVMQRCVDPGYRQEHDQECTAARDNTDPLLLERFRRIVEGDSES
jgi:hypothetical protein